MNREVVFNLFFTASLFLVFVGTLRLLETGKREARTVFFAFAVASVLLSNLYWLAYDILRPGTRMPFAANEIGEWAMFLLLGASLTSLRSINFHQARLEVLCTVLFITASTALWISWSGEWVDDIVTGIVYGYFLCCLVALMKQEEMVPSYKWGMLGGVSLLLIAGQVVIFFVPNDMKRAMEILNMDPAYADRDLNVGFSGGEKKKAEILQLLMLKPSLAILDETDSGLDVDAVRTVSKGVEEYQKSMDGALIIITHSTRILEALHVDKTHVIVNGTMRAEGNADLVDKINEQGFEEFVKQ